MEDKNKVMARRIAQSVAQVGGRVYYVGGLVRDSILGRENKDVDIEVHGITPQALQEILDGLGECISMGESFGIFGLRHYTLDIAMPRARDSKELDPFIGTEQAARRRDLTINSLMQDVLTDEILDPFGGIADLRNGIVRHVDPVTFAEDPLRVFRAAQFAARFGFDIAEETRALCSSLDVKNLAKERILGELEKALLKPAAPSRFFQMLRAMGQLHDWFPEVEALIGVPQEPRFHPEGDVWNHTMLVLDQAALLRSQVQHPLSFMLSALCHDFGKTVAMQDDNGRIRAIGHEAAGVPLAKAFLSRMTNEINLHKYVLNMVELHMRPNIMAAQRSSQKSFCRLFDQSVCPADLLLLAQADHLGRPLDEDYTPIASFLRERLAGFEEIMSRPFVRGEDLVQLGYTPGPQFRGALEFAHKLRLAGVAKEAALRQTEAFLRGKDEGADRK